MLRDARRLLEAVQICLVTEDLIVGRLTCGSSYHGEGNVLRDGSYLRCGSVCGHCWRDSGSFAEVVRAQIFVYLYN